MTDPNAPSDLVDEPLDKLEKAEAPQEAPHTGDEDGPSKPEGKWKSYAWWGLAVCLLVFVIVFPIEMTKRSQKNQANAAQETASDYNTTSDPFETTLSLYNEQILQGYANEDELKNDLKNAVYFQLNQVIKGNAGVAGYEQWNANFGGRGPVFAEPSGGATVDGAPEADMASGSVEGGSMESGKLVGDDVTDYGTNNQEKGIEEGDMVVSDGTLIYAVYGEYIIVWNARTGAMVAQVKMPSAEEIMPPSSANSTSGGTSTSPDNSTTSDGSSGKIAGPDYMYYFQPYIQSLALYGDRLLVIVGGYGPIFQYAELGDTQPALYDYLGTHIRLYDTSSVASTGTLSLVSDTNVNGYFNQVRIINGNAHVMTTATVNTYSYIQEPMARWQFPESMSDTEYVEKATAMATETLVPAFTDELTNEIIKGSGGKMPNLVRVSRWESDVSGTTAEELSFQEGLISSLNQVHSFDMTSDATTLSVSSAGSFLPSSWGLFYGTADSLIIAGQGWNYAPDNQSSSQVTYLLGFSINGASSTPHSVGQVDGYLLNNYAIDVVGNKLRLATSIQENLWWGIAIDPMPMMETNSAATETVADGDTSVSSEPVASSSSGQAADDSMPVQQETNSTTENYIIILEMPGMNGTEAGTMKELGRTKLGEPNELFTAVRFFDNIAYGVTFERTDPFYVVDLSDSTNPTILAALKISGFSSYLHPMNDDNSMILAIGEAADDQGVTTGVQITVFNVTNPAKPFAAARHTIGNNKDDPWSYTYTDSLWDFKSFRYAAEHLIIPMNVYGMNASDSFYGFLTYEVNATHIVPECEISHGDPYNYGGIMVDDAATSTVASPAPCAYCGSLPTRAMIFDGNLMSMMGSSILSSDMDTCAQVWNATIEIQGENGMCCGIWY